MSYICICVSKLRQCTVLSTCKAKLLYNIFSQGETWRYEAKLLQEARQAFQLMLKPSARVIVGACR